MKDQRPHNIGLGSIKSYRFPITAISSILHRITGLLILVIIPVYLIFFMMAFESPAQLEWVRHFLCDTLFSLITWLGLAAASYHVLAGVRHIIMDLGFCEQMGCAKATSILVLILGVIIAVFWGIWLWVM